MNRLGVLKGSRAWKIGAAIFRHPFVLMIIGVIFVFAAVAVANALTTVMQVTIGRGKIVRISASILTCAAAVTAYWLFVRTVERNKFNDFARKNAFGELGIGLLIGGAVMTLSVATIALLGGYHVTAYTSPLMLVPAIDMMLRSSVIEEIMMRGIVFRFTEMATGSWIALFLSAVIFGAMHLGNPNSSWLAAVAIAIEAGIMLGAIYMLTRRLWAAIGIHAGWNFAQAGIFGVPVSGIKMPGLLVASMQGDERLTGGPFGAEASLPALFFSTMFGVVLLVLAIRRGNFIPASWHRFRTGKGEVRLDETS